MEKVTFDTYLRERTLITYIIWVAFTVSAFVYGLICYVVIGQAETSDPGVIDPILLNVFIGLAIVFSLAALTINKKLGSHEGVLKRLSDPTTAENIAEMKEKNPLFSHEEACLAHLLPILFFKTILSMALIESVLIFGFALSFTYKDLGMYFYFALPAFILQLSICPRPQMFLDMCKQVLRTLASQTLEAEDA